MLHDNAQGGNGSENATGAVTIPNHSLLSYASYTVRLRAHVQKHHLCPSRWLWIGGSSMIDISRHC